MANDNVSALLAMSGGGFVDPEKIAEVTSEWLEENLATPSTPPIDSSLTVANAAADAKAAGDAIKAQNASLISPIAKQALLDCFAHVAWADDQGQDYYDALEAALLSEAELESISAVYTQSGTVYDTDSLDSLKADLVVTALYGDGSTQTVPAESYTPSGTLTVGTSTITVSYGGKTATFDVTVTENPVPAEYQQVEYIQSTGTQRILLQGVVSDLRTDGWSGTAKIQNANTSATGGQGILANYDGSNQWLGFWGTNINSSGGVSALEPVEVGFSWSNDGITITHNGNTKTTAYGSSADFNNKTNFCLFAMPSSSSSGYNFYSSTKLFSLTLNKAGVPFRNFIPCYRKSDGVIGLYDSIEKSFYINSGAGTFLKGGDI